MEKNVNETEGMSEQNSLLDRYLIYTIKNEDIAIQLKYVQEVIEVEKVREIPKLSAKFLGIYNLRGNIIPVINLDYILFNKPFYETDETTQMDLIIVNYDEYVFGIRVDVVEDIIELEDEHYEEIPDEIQTDIPIDYLDRIANHNGRIIKVLDYSKILNANFLKDVRAMKKPEKEKAVSSEFGAELVGTTDLTPAQIDALREIANIASGKSVTALSSLIHARSKVMIQVNNVYCRDVLELDQLNFKPDEIVIGIRSAIKNDLTGAIFIIFTLKEMNLLLSSLGNIKLIPANETSVENIDPMTKSAIQEFGNILISHYCSGISDFLRIKMYHDVPEIAIGEFIALIDQEIAKLAQYSEKAIFLETEIKFDENDIKGSLVFIPYYESLQKFVSLLNVDYITGESAGEKSLEKLEKTPSGGSEIKKELKIAEEGSNKKTKKSKEKKTPGAKEKKDEVKSVEKEIFNQITPQKEYKVSENVIKELNLKPDDLNIFQELGNIGAGNAGNALSQMLNKKVLLEIPPAQILKLKELVELFKDYDKMVGYVGKTRGLFETHIFLMFGKEDTANLLHEIIGSPKEKTIQSIKDISKTEKSAIMEISNILMGHYISAISDFLKIKVDPPQYQFFLEKPATLFKKLMKDFSDSNLNAILIQTAIDVAHETKIRGEFVVILSQEIIEKIMERISEIW